MALGRACAEALPSPRGRLWASALRRVWDPVAHDRVDHLHSLAGGRLERLPVAHAALAAPPVVLAEPAAAPAQRVA